MNMKIRKNSGCALFCFVLFFLRANFVTAAVNKKTRKHFDRLAESTTESKSDYGVTGRPFISQRAHKDEP